VKTPVFAAAVLSVVCLPAGVSVIAGECAAEDVQVALEWGVKIPMRDGVDLNATAYPSEGAGPQRDGGVPRHPLQLAFQDPEEFVLGVVGVPWDLVALHADDLDVVPVEVSHDLG
jgi:hypothetical protein